MGKRGGSLKGGKKVLRGHIAQCRGVECAKKSKYSDKELRVLFAVRIIANAHLIAVMTTLPTSHLRKGNARIMRANLQFCRLGLQKVQSGRRAH